MNGPLRLVVSDIDGTLVRSDKSLSEPVIAAARRLTAAGVKMSLISARPPSGMVWIAEKLGLKCPIGAFNGGTVICPDGRVICAERIEPEVAKRVLELIAAPGIVRWLFCDGRWHAEQPGGEHEAHERKAANQEPVFGGDFGRFLGAVDKIVAVSDDAALLTKLEHAVAGAVGEQATVSRSQAYYLDVTALAANKGDGVATLAGEMDVALEQAAVIGDQQNDLAMFKRAGFSIAMGQASDQVRMAASQVCKSNDEDGVAGAIDDILLPMAESSAR